MKPAPCRGCDKRVTGADRKPCQSDCPEYHAWLAAKKKEKEWLQSQNLDPNETIYPFYRKRVY